jgi:hypothetical protein
VLQGVFVILQPLLVPALTTGLFAQGNNSASQRKTEQAKEQVKGEKGGYGDHKASVEGVGLPPDRKARHRR